MRFPIPASPALRDALTTAAGLRRWWDPDAAVADGRATPGVDAPAMAVTVRGDTVTWSGEVVTAIFDLAAGTLAVDVASDVHADERAELALAWELAVAALRWAAARPGPVTWTRRTLPLALAYTDAWGRIDGAEGLAGPGEQGVARVAGEPVVVRRVLARPPRAVAIEAGDALLRVWFGPGDSVNAARIDLLDVGGGLPAGWEAWIARRLGMTWVAQLGEEG